LWNNKLALLFALVVVPWYSWVGFNGLVTVPAWLMMGAVFVTDASPGTTLFSAYVDVVDRCAQFLITEDNWAVTEYTVSGSYCGMVRNSYVPEALGISLYSMYNASLYNSIHYTHKVTRYTQETQALMRTLPFEIRRLLRCI
jgi:hypothetical protein